MSSARIVFVGPLEGGDPGRSRSQQRFQTLRALGHEVTAFDLGSLPAGGIARFHGRVRTRVGLPPDFGGVNVKLVERARAGTIDVLWLERALSVWPWTLRLVRRLQPQMRVGAWIEEHVRYRGNRSLYFGGQLPLVDCAFTPRSQNLGAPWLSQHAPPQLVLVDETYDPEVHAPYVGPDGKAPPPRGDVCFVGSYESARAREMCFLAEQGIDVSVYGTGWEALSKRPPRLSVHGPAFGRDYARALCEHRINLCFLRKLNGDRQTNRTMEIPACGAFMLAERTPEHMRLFREGREAAYFADRDEMLAQIRHYLEHDEERRAIARAGRERVIAGGHSHAERLTYMLDVLRNSQTAPDHAGVL